MAFVLTYNTLLELIPSYLERSDSDVLEQIPTFIVLAQRRISKDTKSLGLETYMQGAFTAGQSVYQKPALWLNTLSFSYGISNPPTQVPTFNEATPIHLCTYEFARIYWPDPTQTKPPKYYSDYGYSNWLIAPTPDQNYPFEVAFLGLASIIDSSQQTNWVTAYAPELLIYATLVEAMIFIKNDERTQYFLGIYQNALQSLMTESKDRLTDRLQDSAKG